MPRSLRVARRLLAGWLCQVALLAIPAVQAEAQESKSAALAKELAELLDKAKLDSIAAKDPAASDQFVAALYFSGAQFLVVSAKYIVPQLLTEKLNKKNYRDIYVDLNSASVPGSKTFVEDLGADGLRARRDGGAAYDTYESGSTNLALDADWKKQKMSEDDYMKAFGAADDKYSKMLSALLAELRKMS